MINWFLRPALIYCILLLSIFFVISTSRAEFSWSNANFNPPGAEPDNSYKISQTHSIAYELYISGAEVGDSIRWTWYHPVKDSRTGLPTGEMEYHTTASWNYRGDHWFWIAWPAYDYWYTSANSLWLDSGLYINGYSSIYYPGKWRIDITRTSGGIETLLTSGYYTLVDDIKPTATFVTPTNGSTLDQRQEIVVQAYDNAKVTAVDLYAKHKETSQLYPLGTINAAGRDGYWHYTWATSQYPIGNYTLIAQAHDSYGNMSANNGDIDVMSYPEVAVLGISAVNDVDISGVTDPVFSAQFAPNGNTAGVVVNKNDPIAALINSVFDLNVTVGAFPVQPAWSPVIEWKYSLMGNSGSGTFTGWSGTIPVSTAVSRVSDRTFQDKDLKLTFIIKDPNTGQTIRRQTESLVFKPRAVKITQYISTDSGSIINKSSDVTFVSQSPLGVTTYIIVTATTGDSTLDSQISWRVYSNPFGTVDGGNPAPDFQQTGTSFSFPLNPPSASTGRDGPLSYVVEASVSINGTTQSAAEIITQDNLDELRQEYIDMRHSANPLPLFERGSFDQTTPAYPRLLDFTNGDIDRRHQWWIVQGINSNAMLLEYYYATRDDAVKGYLGVTSGFRCPSRNSVQRGSTNSYHIRGRALDFNQNDSGENYKVWESAILNTAPIENHLYDQDEKIVSKEVLQQFVWPDLPPDVTSYKHGHAAW